MFNWFSLILNLGKERPRNEIDCFLFKQKLFQSCLIFQSSYGLVSSSEQSRVRLSDWIFNDVRTADVQSMDVDFEQSTAYK